MTLPLKWPMVAELAFEPGPPPSPVSSLGDRCEAASASGPEGDPPSSVFISALLPHQSRPARSLPLGLVQDFSSCVPPSHTHLPGPSYRTQTQMLPPHFGEAGARAFDRSLGRPPQVGDVPGRERGLCKCVERPEACCPLRDREAGVSERKGLQARGWQQHEVSWVPFVPGPCRAEQPLGSPEGDGFNVRLPQQMENLPVSQPTECWASLGASLGSCVFISSTVVFLLGCGHRGLALGA